MQDSSAARRPSPQLRKALGTVTRDLDGLSRKVIESLREEVPAYRSIRDEAMLADIFANVRENLGIVFESCLAGSDVPEARFARVSQYARKRAGQGLPLGTLLHAYRVSCSVVWGSILDTARTNSALRDEILFALSPRAIHQVDLLSRIVQQAYTAELEDRFRHRDRAKRNLAQLVVAGTRDEQTLRAEAAAVGLDPLGLYSAVAFELRQPESEVLFLSDEIGRLLATLARAFGVKPEHVVEAAVQKTLIAWLPHPPSRPASGATDDLAAACRGLFGKESIAARAGVSTALRGVGNWKTASEQARKALEIGRALEPTAHVHRYSALAVRDFVSRTPEVAGFLQHVLEPLAADEGLLRSAETYFATGRHLKMTAAQLGVHRNTLKYRLRRIEQLLGGSFDDADWSLRLQLALKLRQMR